MILFADLISMILIIYVWFRLYMNHWMSRENKLIYFRSGVCLFILLMLDQAWQFVHVTQPRGDRTDLILNTLTCGIFFLIPFALNAMAQLFRRKMSAPLRRFSRLLILAIAVVPVINLWYPLIFYHQNSHFYYAPFHLAYSVFEFAAMVYIIHVCYMRNFPFDRNDLAMVWFAQAIVVVGVAADLTYADLTVTWNSLVLCYLILYLAIEFMYAKLDPVTMLQNRDAYVGYMHRLGSRKFTAVMFDLNLLKDYNDRLGHNEGDAYLHAFAQTMKAELDEFGNLFRIGGDEFCFITTEMSRDEAERLVLKIREKGKCDERYGDYPLDFAFGISERAEGEDGYTAVERADEAMYEEKRQMHADRR